MLAVMALLVLLTGCGQTADSEPPDPENIPDVPAQEEPAPPEPVLPEELQALVLEDKLSAGHCRVLASVPDEELMIKLAGLAAAEGWSVRETERRVADALDAKKLEKRQPKREKLSTDMKSAQDSLREHLGTKVRFRGDENKGKIVIEYYSKDELAGIYDRIMGN